MSARTRTEQQLRTCQRIGDFLTALCLLSALFLLLCFVTFPKTGMEALGIIVPWLAVLALNAILALPALLAAFLTRRHLRNAWIYGYFLLFFGANLAYFVKVNKLDLAIARVHDDISFPEEMSLNRNLETLYISVKSGRNPDPIILEESKNLIRAGTDVNRATRTAQRTPIVHAAGIGDAELVELMVAHGASLQVPEGAFLSPLMEAVAGQHSMIVEILLRAGADPNASQNPLREASRNGDVDTLRCLLSAGADPRAHPQVGFSEGTALSCAVQNGHTEIVRLLLSAGANPMDRSPTNDSLLTVAARNGFTEIAELLQAHRPPADDSARRRRGELYQALNERELETFRNLLEMGADANEPDERGRTLLFLLASSEHPRLRTLSVVEVAAALLDHGADVNAATDYGWTPLMAAAKSGNPGLLALLVERRAALDVLDTEGEAAVAIAAKRCNQDAVLFLLESGADPDARAEGGPTALMLAARNGCRETVEHLLAAGADADARTEGRLNHDYPLLAAVRSGDAEIVRRLIRAGACIDESGRDKGELFIGKNPEIVTLLIQTGIDLNRPDGGNHYPIVEVLETGNVESLRLLLEAGASPDVTAHGGRQPILVAARHSSGDALPLLLDHSASLRADRGLLEKALWTAVEHGNLSMIDALLGEGVTISPVRVDSAIESSRVLKGDPEKAAAIRELFQEPSPEGR